MSWIYDYARNDDERAAMELDFGNSEFGRPYIAPPGRAGPVVDICATPFEDTMTDPDFSPTPSASRLTSTPRPERRSSR